MHFERIILCRLGRLGGKTAVACSGSFAWDRLRLGEEIDENFRREIICTKKVVKNDVVKESASCRVRLPVASNLCGLCDTISVAPRMQSYACSTACITSCKNASMSVCVRKNNVSDISQQHTVDRTYQITHGG